MWHQEVQGKRERLNDVGFYVLHIPGIFLVTFSPLIGQQQPNKVYFLCGLTGFDIWLIKG